MIGPEKISPSIPSVHIPGLNGWSSRACNLQKRHTWPSAHRETVGRPAPHRKDGKRRRSSLLQNGVWRRWAKPVSRSTPGLQVQEGRGFWVKLSLNTTACKKELVYIPLYFTHLRLDQPRSLSTNSSSSPVDTVDSPVTIRCHELEQSGTNVDIVHRTSVTGIDDSCKVRFLCLWVPDRDLRAAARIVVGVCAILHHACG